jgi:hypothetical protein
MSGLYVGRGADVRERIWADRGGSGQPPAKTNTDWRAIWGLLHRRALQPVADAAGELKWLRETYRAYIPCGECKAEFDLFLKSNPPDFGDYFGWTVALHNHVSAKLGKPALTPGEARREWD